MVAHSFVPLPAEIIAIANGMVFGAVVGSIITWTGAMLGAICAFALARWRAGLDGGSLRLPYLHGPPQFWMTGPEKTAPRSC
jgi:hypothetical protein